MVLGFLGDLTIVYNQLWGSRPWFSNQETGTAVMGVVPLLIFFNEASIYTFLDLALDFFNLYLWSGIGTTLHSRLFKFRFQFQVYSGPVFYKGGEAARRRTPPHRLSAVTSVGGQG